MNDLRRELAPISSGGWKAIEEEARRTLKAVLAGRKLAAFEGPLGWQHAAVNLGRTRSVASGAEPIETRVRRVQPLVELRAPFTLRREELDSIDRGAADPDLEPVVTAARQLGRAEDLLVFEGLEAAGIQGICRHSAHKTLRLTEKYDAYPNVVAEAIEVLREAGIAGPYAIALGPRCYTGLSKTTAPGGYPVIQHVRRLLDGPVVWAPAVDGAVVLSLRGGDFMLSFGRDASIGYLSHDAQEVRLYLEESLTFRLLTPEAAVALRYNE